MVIILMALLDENFYRCPKCNSAYFEEKVITSVRKDPPRLTDEEFERVRLTAVDTKFRYVCIECGEVLDRASITKAAHPTPERNYKNVWHYR